jgi:hypothetical protein
LKFKADEDTSMNHTILKLKADEDTSVNQPFWSLKLMKIPA